MNPVLLLPLLLTSFSPLTTALTSNAYTSHDCTGPAYATCTDIPSGTCCAVIDAPIDGSASGSHGASSGGWTGLSAATELMGYSATPGGTCGVVLASKSASDDAGACLPAAADGGQFAGISWGTAGRDGRVVEFEACRESRWPDVIRVAGREYCAAGAGEGVVRGLLALAINGTGTGEGMAGFGGFLCR